MKVARSIGRALVTAAGTLGAASIALSVILAAGEAAPFAVAAVPSGDGSSVAAVSMALVPYGPQAPSAAAKPIALLAKPALMTPTPVAAPRAKARPVPRPARPAVRPARPRAVEPRSVARPVPGTAPRTSRGGGSGWSSARCSWYGPGFYGNTMAGGGVLTQSSMVVAHKSMPFGTRIQFEYNGRTATAVVQDRGPYIAGRTFDLGPGLAAALGFSGVHSVRYRIVGR